MQQTASTAQRSKSRNAIYLILITVINGALLWTIWNYKSMPVAYTFEGSWGILSIRAPWGKVEEQQAARRAALRDRTRAFGAQQAFTPSLLMVAPPIKVNAQGNPERGSSYRLYRCMVNGYPTFSDTPCDNPPKSQKP